MATLKRVHAPLPWAVQVEQMVWKRSKRGKPRRGRSDRPPLTYDPGWDWDGTRILFSEKSEIPVEEERKCGEDAHCSILSDNEPAALSLLDVARYQVTKRRGKARCGFDDFEVVRVPRVVPVPEERDIGHAWTLADWEKLDTFGSKRTYSEVARVFVDGKDPPYGRGCSRPSNHTEDDAWECL